MRKYLEEYLSGIYAELDREHSSEEWERLKREHFVQIGFMQHERLIHLIVTCLFAFLTILSAGIFCISGQIGFAALTVLSLALIIPYIRHYYFLENSVQKMYIIYNKLCEHDRG